MLKCYSFPYEEQEASDNTDLSLRVQTVGLCHPAAGHQDLNASPCDIHLVLYCWEWCACLCLQRQAGGYCGQNLRLASLLAETNVSIIASWGKTAVLCPCTVEQATRSEAGGYNNRGGSWGHDSEANQTGRFLLWKAVVPNLLQATDQFNARQYCHKSFKTSISCIYFRHAPM